MELAAGSGSWAQASSDASKGFLIFIFILPNSKPMFLGFCCDFWFFCIHYF